MASEKRKSVADAGPPSKKVKNQFNGVHPDRAPFQKPKPNGAKPDAGKEGFLNGRTDIASVAPSVLTLRLGTNSKEAHYKQKQLKAERIAAKPNSDSIARSKKIWERLRIKSAVPKDERQKLVEELFGIITGRVKDFVFKHDSVRVIQCALKYSTPDQRQQIAQELQGSYRELAESKYAKFLVAKFITQDPKVRDLVVPEFYGHVKRLIRHPEASWIMDDIYRTMATPDQKARLLREWYGGEYAVQGLQGKEDVVTADLSQILRDNPGKRGPIMQQLKEMTNQLVQKKTTGFTILHDALLQYFLNCNPGTPEHTEFLDLLRDDEEGDLFKNLAFTKSGSRIVCLALAYCSSKDRRNFLKHFKTHFKLMAADMWAHVVLLVAYEVIDDTVMTAKAIFSELTGKDLDKEAREQDLLGLASSINGRMPLLYVMAEQPPKWLLDAPDHDIIKEIREIRKETSKKDPPTRRLELNRALTQPLLDFITSQAESLLQSSYGCQFLGEVLIGGVGEKDAALDVLTSLAVSDSLQEAVNTPHAGRVFKMLVQGGRFDPVTKTVVPAEPPLNFSNKLYDTLAAQDDGLLAWATSPNSWSIVAMVESEGFEHKDALVKYLNSHKAELEAPKDNAAANSGTKVLLEKIGTASHAPTTTNKKSRRQTKSEDVKIAQEVEEEKPKKKKSRKSS